MMARYQLPAYSPLSLSAVSAGLGAMVGLGPGRGRGGPAAIVSDLLLDRFDAREGRLFDSGTHALQAALVGVRERKLTPVALPAFTCYDVATAAIGAEVPVLFYDLDPRTLAPDLTTVAAALERGARSLVVSPLFGYPPPWEEVVSLCKRAGVCLIEDAAQAVGSSYRGRPSGTWGDLTVLSFGRGKGWTGSGGGALLLRGERTREWPGAWHGEAGVGRLRETRTLVSAVAQLILGRPALFGVPSRIPFLALGETHYRTPSPPSRMAAVSAAMILENAPLLQREKEARADSARHYRAALEACGSRARHVRPIEPLAETEPSWLRFAFRIEGGLAGLPEDRARRLGIRQSYPLPLHRLPAMLEGAVRLASGAPGAGEVWPGAEDLAARLLTAPTHSLTTAEDRTAVVALLAGSAS